MLNWFANSCGLLGLSCQNWVLVIAGGCLLYLTALAVAMAEHKDVF